jgi:ribosomal protein S18 acetylase RimI-like enzyme
VHIRAARQRDLAVMQDIERAAGSWFGAIGMAEIAGDAPLPGAELARYRQDGRAWVAADDADVPAAYLIAGLADGSLHIEQVPVHPRAAGRKIGRLLLDHAAADAAAQGYPRAHADHRRRGAVERPVLCALRVPRPAGQRAVPGPAGRQGP